MSKPSSDMTIDAARLPVMLSSLRLPSFGQHWQGFAARADREGWGAARSSSRAATPLTPFNHLTGKPPTLHQGSAIGAGPFSI